MIRALLLALLVAGCSWWPTPWHDDRVTCSTPSPEGYVTCITDEPLVETKP